MHRLSCDHSTAVDHQPRANLCGSLSTCTSTRSSPAPQNHISLIDATPVAMDKLNYDQILEAISVDDADLLPLANGKTDPIDNDPIQPVLEYLREEIGVKTPQLEVGRAIQVIVPPREWTEEEKYGIGVLILEGKGWKIDGEKREKLLKFLGKSDKDVIPVYLME